MLASVCWVVVFIGGSMAAPPGPLDRGYVAEWQWEQWPLQRVQISRNLSRNPGSRMGSSLWFDSSASSWWLFGGRQVPNKNNTKFKIYTDLWRYDTSDRNWNRIFPNDKLKSLVGGMITLRTSLFNDGLVRKSASSSRNPGVVLCGRSEGKNLDERSLAVYGPRSSRSDTVWQLELKDKQWTAYVCCCDNTERSTAQNIKNASSMPTGTIRHESNVEKNYTIVHGKMKNENCSDTVRATEEINSGNSDNTKNNTKKFKETGNYSSNLEDAIKLDGSKSNKEHKTFDKQETNMNIDNIITESSTIIIKKDNNNHSFDRNNNFTLHDLISSVSEDINNESTYVNQTSLENEKHCLPELHHENIDVLESNASSINSDDSNEDHKLKERDVNDDYIKYGNKQNGEFESKANDSNQAFCPDFQANTGSSERSKGQPVAWCDTDKELLVALDLKVIPLTLWQFDLKTSHWAQQKVDIEDGILWPGCSSGIRYASTGSSVYILCLPYGSTKPTSTRLVYKIDANNCSLQASGQLQLNNMFDSPEGNAMWADETKTILQTVNADNNKTLLLIAYDKLLDIWVLDRNSDRGYFVQVENIWRGSALKWFRAFNAPFYNLHMAGQSWLLPNPRQVTDYWPHERGRFIIRLIDHSSSPVKEELHTLEMKNHSESGIPVLLQHHQAQDGIKALVFFAFSLSIFAIFGMTIFVRRCVTCPPQSWPLCGDDGNKTTPPVIQYSVIPDDLAYPVA